MKAMEAMKPGRAAARAGMAAVLAVALAAAPLGAPGRALAEDGSVTIEGSGGAYEPVYSAYRVFAADIGEGDVATHVAWPGDGVKAAVLSYLDDNGYAAWLAAKGRTAAGARDVAQNALEFTGESIAASARAAGDVGAPRTTAGGSFANGLAAALLAAGLDAHDVTGGQTLTAPEGYYLIVTQTYGAYDTGTAPIWLALGGDSETVAPKKGAVSLAKTVKAAGDASYAAATDTYPGQELDYRLSATLPANLGAYGSFYLEVEDFMTNVELSGGDLSSVSVKVGATDVTSRLLSGEIGSLSLTEHGFDAVFPDILAAPGATRDTVVTIDYKASVTARAGSDGGTNYARIEYSKDPNAAGHQSDATRGPTPAFSYRARLTKADKSSGVALPGAKYTVRLREYAQEPAKVGNYVQADGTLADEPYEFTTGADGTVVVGGLDAGSYTVHETAAPEHYELQDADVVLTVSPTVDGSLGRVTALAGSVTGGEAASVAGDESTRVTGADASTRTVDVLLVDDRAFALPATGLEGAGAFYALAAVLGAGGVAGVAGAHAAARKRDRGGDER